VNPAIVFEPDGYLLTGPKLMGRQSAGAGFLRAAVQGRGDQPVRAFTPSAKSAEVFRSAVADIDPAAATEWIAGHRLDLLAATGLLYRPDQLLGPMARQRLRAGPAAYSLCGVTHTLATAGTLDAIAKILVEPVMPWDALICTSKVALAVIDAVLDREEEHQRWRTRQDAVRDRPLLPVIPLGVHTDDFAFADEERQGSRTALGLGDTDVAVLFAGRLSVAGKAHPYPMLRALQDVARDTGKSIVLLLAGQTFNAAIRGVFESALATFCPDVRPVFVDGKDFAAYRGAWAAADIFISLADSIQETFGLTPLEAMAAGLPALVSDWNGYKDTVRDGVDGFRIPTWAPAPGAGDVVTRYFEAQPNGYDDYLYRSNTAVAVDMGELRARLRDLVLDEALRRRMGAAGRARARSTFDWRVIFRSYQSLWNVQTELRRRAAADPATQAWLSRAPASSADHMGPFDTFASYPTRHVAAATIVSRAPEATPEAYRALIADPLLSLWRASPELTDRVLAALEAGPLTVETLAAATGVTIPQMTEVAARLAKIDLLILATGPSPV
jgi:glycosyltransferase involved in cell wall biosynthesis